MIRRIVDALSAWELRVSQIELREVGHQFEPTGFTEPRRE